MLTAGGKDSTPGWGIKILHATGSVSEKEKYVVFFRRNVTAARQKEKKMNMLYFLDIMLLHT